MLTGPTAAAVAICFLSPLYTERCTTHAAEPSLPFSDLMVAADLLVADFGLQVYNIVPPLGPTNASVHIVLRGSGFVDTGQRFMIRFGGSNELLHGNAYALRTCAAPQ